MNDIRISDAANLWLGIGERGISSETIFSHLTGVHVLNGMWRFDGPHDFSDWRRCEMLLQAVPEFRDRFAEMKTVSPLWARLVDEWPSLAEMWRAAGGGDYCPAITARLFQIHDEVQKGGES